MKSWQVIAGAAILVALGLGVLFWYSTTAPNRPDLYDPELVAQGETLYAQYCASCHGVNLGGEPNWRERKPDGTFPAPPHDETGHTWHHGDEYLFLYTNLGGAALANGRFQSAMPGFGEQLSDHQIWAIIAYIKSQWPPQIRDAQERRQRD